MNGVCDTWCEGCEYLSHHSEVYCNYMAVMYRRRPCPAGRGCTARRRPPKWRADPRLKWVERASIEAARKTAFVKKLREDRCGRRRDPFCVSLTPEYQNRMNQQYRARRAADEIARAEGMAIKSWRKESGITQKDLGQLMGLSGVTISDWERGLGCARWDLLEKLGCRRPAS